MESTKRIRANIRVQDACQEQALLQYEKDILTEAAGSLREGEVVPVLEASGAWLRVGTTPAPVAGRTQRT